MLRKASGQIKIDPSNVHQTFRDVDIKLFCCRYWVLEEWEFNDLKAPFWRIYYNSIPGAVLTFREQTIILDQKSILIIPPNTSFSTQLKAGYNKKEVESVKGNAFTAYDDLKNLKSQNKVDHLFIHFSLGYPMDLINNDIYVIKCSTPAYKQLKTIRQSCLDDAMFSFQECLRIKYLIIRCLLKLPDQIWRSKNMDQRIINSIKFIEENYKQKITNEQLADDASMATNSFARLFKTALGISMQQYILKSRVEAACNLLHHTNKSLDEIAYECGFSDRHHFSKVFKKVMAVNPSDYKKRLKIT